MASNDKELDGDRTRDPATDSSETIKKLEALGVGTDDEGYLVLPPGGIPRERKPEERWIWQE
jgi:hypothetical protein